ncbi:RICIN domain-containing protein [Bacillus sp. ISL-40]|uniref:glycoside hydrolase n=1 Tax=unclassified Bacillus (in: firmicutes) TaxID=185979 RepID=UPI001BE96526|nr:MULTISPECIES: glycoside hydrolase [unclassified Bacillus (in: firmicutes)]MBT2700394.1 RICIN domain-containing protein [Bacillus sp. ISL-40]MBT2741682.1 RICIN domain-containing protein [Bacillus sp. ISL-77]
MVKANFKQMAKKIITCGSATALTLSLLAPAAPVAIAAEETQSNTVTETVKLDPSYQQAPFDGWGTALVWFANITGGWPDEIKNQVADALYGKDGLNFNIARYNIGGGDSPETTPYMRLGGAVPGYWNRPAEFGPPNGNTEGWTEPTNWWDPKNPDHWNWNADANQRWWLTAAKSRGADTFEAFSNSAPYFMTQSGYVSGNWDSNKDNLKPDQYTNFASYLTGVVDHLQQETGIQFKTLSPVNEPNTNYWGAKGRQEGSHWAPASQAKMINEVKTQLTEKGMNTVVSAMDETNPSKFRSNWDAYNTETRNNIEQLNVHTYGTGERNGARDIAKGAGKKLWMSEVDLSVGGQNHEDIKPGLAISERIQADIQQLEPEAWVLWQAVEDEVNMRPEHENGNWGLIQVDFAAKDFSNFKIYKNKKYYAVGNYSKFIRPGDQFINTNNQNTLAAIDTKDDSVVVVYTNSSAEQKVVDFDLSGFETINGTASATPYVTSATDNLQKKEDIKVKDEKLAAVVPAQSITTFVVSGVSGVNNEASFVNNHDKYKISNLNSGKVLDITQDGKIVQKTYDRDKAAQQWSIQKVSDGYSSRELYKIVDTNSSKVIGVENGVAVEQSDQNTDSQKWMLSTSGNQQYTFINAANGQLLEVGGESTKENATVDVWQSNAGKNQSWIINKAGIVEIEPANVVVTKKKIAPDMPQEVTTIYGDVERVQKAVKWEPIDPEQYDRETTFTVRGTVEGTEIPAVANVTVSKVEGVEPIKVKTVPGKAPELPEFVPAKLEIGTEGNVRVNWETIDPSKYETFAKFTVKGSIPYSPVKVTANVQVTKPALQNIALNLPGSGQEFPKATASFTGQYDKAANVNDGDISSIRWTNWDPNSWRSEDWVAIDFGSENTISKLDFHFYDDGGGTRPPASLQLEYWDGTEWKAIDGTQLDVNAKKDLTVNFAPVTTSKVRVVMKAMPNTCIAISEIEVFGKGDVTKAEPSIGDDATLESILIDGKPLKDFQPDQFTYDVKEKASNSPVVTALTNDLFASYQVSEEEDAAVITVKSEDGLRTETYMVKFR